MRSRESIGRAEQKHLDCIGSSRPSTDVCEDVFMKEYRFKKYACKLKIAATIGLRSQKGRRLESKG